MVTVKGATWHMYQELWALQVRYVLCILVLYLYSIHIYIYVCIYIYIWVLLSNHYFHLFVNLQSEICCQRSLAVMCGWVDSRRKLHENGIWRFLLLLFPTWICHSSRAHNNTQFKDVSACWIILSRKPKRYNDRPQLKQNDRSTRGPEDSTPTSPRLDWSMVIRYNIDPSMQGPLGALKVSTKYLGVSENSVPLNPMVNDHYPY